MVLPLTLRRGAASGSSGMGGLVYFRLGRVPQLGEVVKLDNLLLTVEQVDEHRINKVRIKKIDNELAGEENNTNDHK